ADLLAVNTAAAEGLLVKSLAAEVEQPLDLTLLVDSSSARAVTMRRGVGKMKHLKIKQLWLHQAVRDRKLVVEKINTEVNPADLLTKCLPATRHAYLCEMLGLWVPSETAPMEVE
ncbi:unnamed protein product, partial [Polarella glacialis]